MSNEAYIFEVSKNSFEQTVLQNSHKIPVLVEFLGIWSGPCISMADDLSNLAKEFASRFIFAKVDIEEQSELRKEYHIENVPTLIVFQDGKITRTEVGQLSEEELRQILNTLNIRHESDQLREQARAMHLAGDTPGAITLLAQAAKIHPANTRVAMDMVRIFIDILELEQAESLFNQLPDREKESHTGRNLAWDLTFARQAARTDGMESLQKQVLEYPDNSQVRFDLSICQINQYQYDEAMENLFHIQQHDPDYKDGAARELIITMINMFKQINPDSASSYQMRLSNMLAG